MKVKYGLISKYRAEIMGLAIIMIMVCHNTMVFPGILKNINSAFKAIGDAGVNVFFLLSGYGCYFSLKKGGDVLAFYKKRFIRIVLPLVVVVLLYSIVTVGRWGQPLSEYLWDYSLVSFFAEANLHEWFIAAIIVMYILFPLIFKLVEKNEGVFIALIVALYLLAIARVPGVVKFYSRSFNIVYSIFIVRIPDFLIGTLLAKKTMEDQEIKQSWLSVLCFLGVIATAVSLYAFKFETKNYWIVMRTIFVFVTALVIIVWIALRIKTEGNKVMEAIAKALTFLGGITLEIYLVHEKMLSVVADFSNKVPVGWPYIITIVVNVVAVAITIVIAHFMKKAMDALFKSKKEK